ncbi:unnamed protein product [Cunninghamella blakesleeana]
MYISSLFVICSLFISGQFISYTDGNVVEKGNPSFHQYGKTLRMPITKKRPQNKVYHPSLLQKRADNSFKGQLYNDQGSQYLVTVGVGTPPQEFLVTLDTGSTDLWVASSDCNQESCPFGGFTASQSSTFTKLNEAFSIQYGIGAVNGSYVQDTVTVAGASVKNQQLGLAYETQDILIPTQSTDGSTSDMNANGILGLGYPSLAASNSDNGPYTPFVFNLIKQQIIQEPIFSIYLNTATKQGWSGEVIFGGMDASKFTGNLVYLPVAKLQPSKNTEPSPEGEGNPKQHGNSKNAVKQMFSFNNNNNNNDKDGEDIKMKMIDAGLSDEFLQRIRHNRYSAILNKNRIPPQKSNDASSSSNDYEGYYYWMVYGYGIGVNNGKNSVSFKLRKSGGAFILDTGTTLTYLPNDVAHTIAVAIAGGEDKVLIDRQSGLLIIDCRVAKSNATFTLQMASNPSMTGPPVNFTIKASELVIPIDTHSPITATQCLFGIAPVGGSSALGQNLFLIGDSLLRSAYLIFDYGHNRVGIAAAINMGSSVNGTNSTDNNSSISDPYANGARSLNFSSTSIQIFEIYIFLLILITTCFIQLY